MTIRQAGFSDLLQMLEIYAAARQFMKTSGNPDQWKDSYPPEAVVKKGIEEGKAFLCLAEGGKDEKAGEVLQPGEVLGTFYFAVEDDPTYDKIYEGCWLNEEPYGVVHRVAGSGKGKGLAGACFAWAGGQCRKQGIRNLRIDTHRDNRVMQHVLEKNGFIRCGIIYLEDGAERLAYQKQIGENNI